MEKVYYFFLSIILHFYFLEAYIATNINTDRLALLALKASVTLNSSHPLFQNWTSQASVCSWIGVTCGSRHHRVTALNISNMNIQGPIPQQLGNLSFLVSLDMSNNNLHGGLPQDLFRLRRLKYMNLSYNNLNGAIPPDIANLERLQLLSLRKNNLQGTIPTKIGNLRNLQILALRHNKIVGSIPHTISNMSSLYALDLCRNNLTEYGSAGLVSTSCDVYSYGIMLMETFTRKRPQEELFQENLSMRSWVCNSLAATVEDIVDSTLLELDETGFNKKLHCVSSILELALNCTVESPSERLNMKDILANIKEIKLGFLCK